jgi:hypothetical protein
VQAVVNELYDEKIDIVRWSPEAAQFIAEALSPAKAVKVTVDEGAKSAFVIVPDNQLSLAIGKSGQNVRLAARLTGWRIDIRSESQVARASLIAATSDGEEPAAILPPSPPPKPAEPVATRAKKPEPKPVDLDVPDDSLPMIELPDDLPMIELEDLEAHTLIGEESSNGAGHAETDGAAEDRPAKQG